MNPPLRRPAITPAAMPRMTSKMKAPSASWTVRGNRSIMMSETSRPRKSVPKSPVTSPPTYLPYWITSGSSRLYSSRMAWIVLGATGRSPKRARTGSPGMANTSA